LKKELHRVLKKAKGFEIQRIVKKMKTVEKSETEGDLEKLEGQLETTKVWNILQCLRETCLKPFF